MEVDKDKNWIRTDAEARDIVEKARRSNKEIPHLKLEGGDLAKTLGITSQGRTSKKESKNEFIADVGSVLLDGKLHWFVAHLVVWNKRPKNFSRNFFAVMNAAWLDNLNLTPKSHPGDEKLDVIEAKLNYRDSREFKKRALSGTHIPHANIKTRKITAETYEFEKPRCIYLDNVLVGKVKQIAVRIEPKAFTILI